MTKAGSNAGLGRFAYHVVTWRDISW